MSIRGKAEDGRAALRVLPSLSGSNDKPGGSGARTASELVRSALRRAILNGDLPGGTPLTLVDVASALEVSTTPVREALRLLASEGFIQLDSYRGGVVRVLSRSEIEEVVNVRRLLEPTAVVEAIQGLTADILARAEAVMNQMLELPQSDSWVEWNRAFHDVLYEGVKSRHLIAVINTMQDPVRIYVSAAIRRHPGFRTEANHQHVQIFNAMQRRDAGQSIELTLRHIALPITATEEYFAAAGPADPDGLTVKQA